MAEIPDSLPASLRAGDTWKWTRTLADYPAGVWTLKYRFKNSAGGFEVVTTASGTDHLAAVSAATSATIAAGDYEWIGWVESAGEKYTIESGSVTVSADYRSTAASTALDDRSHARKMLAAIETWLESRDPAVAEYEIAGRRMKYVPIAELLRLRSRYKNEVAAEEAAAAIARGEGIGRKIQFRM
jgi:hypothetical protein